MYLKNKLVLCLLGFLFLTTAQAGKPLWTIVPVLGYPPNASIGPQNAVTIKYSVTNQSSKTHTLRMQPIPGIVSSGCTSSLESQQTCILNLTINGAALTGNIVGGPKICENFNQNQCYNPSPKNRLNIHLITSTYTVSSSGDNHENINPNTNQTVSYGATQTYIVTPETGYTVSNVVGGTCPLGAW